MSLNAAAVRLMAEKGLSASDIADIMEAMEAKPRPMTDAERAKNYRVRKMSERHENHVTNVTPPIPPLDKEKSPTPPKEINPPLTPGELEADASCASGDAPDAEPEKKNGVQAESLKPEHFAEAWNDLAKRLGKPIIRSITPERRVRLKARIAGYSLEDFREVLGNIERSPFLRGDRQWQGCTFDWVTKKANFQKILEGNYSG